MVDFLTNNVLFLLQKILEVQGISRNCMTFAGMIQYRMPRE